MRKSSARTPLVQIASTAAIAIANRRPFMNATSPLAAVPGRPILAVLTHRCASSGRCPGLQGAIRRAIPRPPLRPLYTVRPFADPVKQNLFQNCIQSSE